LAKIQREREIARAESMADAKKMAKKLDGVSVTITVKTSEGDKLYGSVGEQEIADALKAQGIEVDRGLIDLESHIKELGVFDVKIKLHPDVESSVKVWIVEE
jgi:large subunit ribosomal protein L9